jgi:hypothetical protein
MRLRTLTIIIAGFALILANTCPAGSATPPPDVFDIGSAGMPTITGSLGGSAIGLPGTFSDLMVTVNFGELSPINRNRIVKVIVPIAIRSTDPYQVSMSVAGAFSNDPNALQLADIGFGIQNLRRLGNKGTHCGANSIITPPFNHDPELTVNQAGPVTYQATLATVGPSKVILRGPKLTNGNIKPRRNDNGWAFDVVLAVVPQYFTSGSFSATLVFTMAPGPPFECHGASGL